ncbi:MAG: imidazole glycerol phosphate synthase subunit HisH [Syntrophales bacterium]
MVGIVDYGMGNLLSVVHALEMVGAKVKICSYPQELRDTYQIVLPGVGAFRDCMLNLDGRGFTEVLNQAVFEQGKPILGICLGMQAMARKSYEGGVYAGLSWFDAEVVRLQPVDPSLRIPHIGWNEISFKENNLLFSGVRPSSDFYFVHSYYMKCENEMEVYATCDYGGSFTAAVLKNNIFATQFHPEKSQDYGLKILENFLKWRP